MFGNSQIANWKNPVKDIKDPLKQRWAEICQTMDTHLSGVCPLHIYVQRRPLESQNSYALEYRANNFEPLTKEAFDKAISGIVEVCTEANIEVKVPDVIKNYPIEICETDVYFYCLSELVRVRESDPNAIVVVLPEVQELTVDTVSVIGISVQVIPSKDIDRIEKDYVRFVGGHVDVNGSKKQYYIVIKDGQYSIDYPTEDGYTSMPIVSITPQVAPYTWISSNVVTEGRYRVRLPYLYGAAAWGNKFYGNESDVSIQETRFTYLKEIRAKQACKAFGSIVDMKTGRHINSDTGNACSQCGGSGYIKDESPLSVIEVDYDKLASEGKTTPTVVQYAEPPQTVLTNAQTRVDAYYDRMCVSLGLVKQNLTNQSGASKEFDYKEKLSVIYQILKDNIRILEYIYRSSEQFLNMGGEIVSRVYIVGEIGKSTVDDLLSRLKDAKENMSPPNIIMDLIDQIYYKTINPEVSEIVIDIAKQYDKLYIYGADELTTARANLGNSIGIKDVIIHNTIITVLEEFLEHNEERDPVKIKAYLDEYYANAVPAQTALL